MLKRRNELAPCGVFCYACPSYNKTCNGCSSENINQKRKSKWNCKIRNCCYEEMKVEYCVQCISFPCEKINSKLINSHLGDRKFRYRHEIPKNMNKLKKLGVDKYIKFMKRDHTCRYCNGTIHFYHYKCSICGKPSNKD